ncbi:DUF2207 family protein, partial [Patescibacteria group bacterium]
KLFEKKLNKDQDLYLALLGLSMFTFNILLGIASWFFGRKSTKRTDLGIQKYSEAQSLRNFLVSQDEKLDFQAQNQMFFEKLLPYATAFGVEDVWVKRFGDLEFTQPDWYDGDVSNMALISSSINRGVVRAASMSSTRSSSGFSSGFSGGSSGGGGGGGSTGSW